MRLYFFSFMLVFGVLSTKAQELSISNLDTQITEEIELGNNYNTPAAPQQHPKVTLSSAEKKLIKAADEAFDNMWYSEAASNYAQAFAKGRNIPAMQTLQKAADSYYYIGDMENASLWYNVLFEKYRDVMSKDDLFKYSHVLKGIHKKEKAERILAIIAEKDFDNNPTVPSFLKHTEKIVLKNLGINSKYSEFGTAFKNDGSLVYASASDTGTLRTRKYRWNNQPFLDLYEARTSENSHELSGIKKLNKKINTKHHEASATFSPDGKTMYFTRNNDKKRRKKVRKTVNHLKIFISQLEEDKWSDPKEVPFNDEEYSTGHPVLTADGKKMYFVSDMPGGFGGTDIYEVDLDENGSFSEPRNLGSQVNSERKEMFPFINGDTIYFSSDRKSGLGGLDIYRSIIREDSIEAPKNLGMPFNSERDDFSFTLKKETEEGYLASNRKGGKGDDDIYYFSKKRPKGVKENKNIVNGIVVDALTNEPVPNANIVLYDTNKLKMVEVETDDEGKFILENLIPNYDYIVNVTKEAYQDIEEPLKTEDNVEIRITKKLIPVDSNIDIVNNDDNKPMFKTEAVYFNFDSSVIREDAKEELDKLANYLVENGSVKLKIESHTDARGDNAYNKYLSQNRAKASKAYLLAKGVAADQIVSAIGYGEERLRNNCMDGTPCSRDAHQLNRRSEFLLIYE